MNTERNMLLGILAVQMNFISRDDLIAAMNGWVLAKHRPIGGILVEQGALTSGRRQLLEQLVDEHLQAHGGNSQRSLASVTANGRMRADLASIPDPELKASLAAAAPVTGDETRAELPESFAPERYRILRPHARGGLGEVFVAEDTELQREVALKEIQPKHADNQISQARFLREAAVTGRLEHPGVVPVYGMGRHADGRPFYAMRFIRGQTLQAAIEDFHAKKLPYDSLDFRQLLQRFVAVCNVIAFAHNRAVLHRDIKPANIMLGAYGETLVVDWGLAKILASENEVAVQVAPSDQPTSDGGPGASEDQYLTIVGQMLPTPAYMSPEQAGGQLNALGPASDIWSLGATLYCLLTGGPPFKQESSEGLGELLQRVQRGAFVLPHRIKPQIPRPLEAIVLHALQIDPAKRYGSALDLAADIEHYLADDPVSCQKESLASRVARTIRRRPRTTATVLSLVAMLSLVGFFWWLGAGIHRRHLADRASTLQREAEANVAAGNLDAAKSRLVEAVVLLKPYPEFHGAWSEANALLLRVGSQQQREHENKVRIPECLRLLDEAEFHLRGSLWARLTHELKQPERRLPSVSRHRAELVRGIELADKALAMYGLPGNTAALEQLLALGIDEAEVARLRHRAAETLFWCALGLEREAQAKGDTELREVRRRAAALLEQAEQMGNRARALHQQRAGLLALLGLEEEAEAARRRGGDSEPTTFIDQHLAGAEASLAGRTDEAIAAFQLALQLRPNDYWTLFRLAKALENKGQLALAEKLMRSCLALRPQDETTCNSLGDLLFKMRQWDAAVREFEEAIRRDPNYFLPYANLVLVHAERKDVQAAEAVLNRCLARGPLPAVAEARLWKHLGVACERAAQREAALANYTKAIALDPKDPALYRNRSILLAAFARHAEAASDIAIAQALAPKDGELHYVQGNYHADRQELTEAVAAYSRALELAPSLRAARYNRGVILRRLRRFPEALDDQTRCLADTSAADPLLKDILLERALNLANLRDYRAALDDLDTLLVQDRTNVAALVTRGKLHADLGRDLVRSEEDLSLAIHLDPRDPEAYRSRGLTRFRAENWYGSIADYWQYLTLVPNAPDAASIWNDISIAELNLGHKSEALAALARAERAGPTAGSRTNRGNIYLQSGEVQAALDDFNQAIQLDPGHARAWALRGQVRLREGLFEEAAADLRKALGSGNALYETTLLAGLAFHRAGKKEEARQLLLTVARDRPDHPRGRLAQAVLDLDEKHYAAAVGGLSSAADDPFLRPFALSFRSRAWIALGPESSSQALADAEAVCSAWPRDGFARFEAALVHAQAAELLATPSARSAALDRASQLLAEAGELGYFKFPVHASRLRTEQAFSPLKDRPVVQKLLGSGISK